MTNTQRKTWATQAFHGVYYRHAMHVSDKAMSNVITSIPTQEPAKGIVQERNVVHGASIVVPRERITKIRFERVSKEVCDAFLSMEDMTTTVGDVLDGYGIDGAIPASYLKPLAPGMKICRPAVTIRNIPVRKTATQGSVDHDFIAMSTRDIYYIGEPGDVLVSDFGGNLEVSNMGGQSRTVA